LEEDVVRLREYNREESSQIDSFNSQVDQKGKESVDHSARIRALEYDISKSLARIDDLTRLYD